MDPLFEELMMGGQAAARREEFDLEIHYVPAHADLTISTSLYHGESFIPRGIRQALSRDGLVANDGLSHAAIVMEPEEHRVLFNYSTHLGPSEEPQFQQILGDYISLAQEWKELLSEFDAGREPLLP